MLGVTGFGLNLILLVLEATERGMSAGERRS